MKTMKKIAAAILAVSMLAGCSKAPASTAGVSGTFEGTAKGFAGDVTVSITLEDSKLVDATITGEKETPAYGGQAMEAMQKAMVENGTVNVDAFAGATFTSNGVQEAVKAAVEAAGLTMEDFAVIETVSGETFELTTQAVIIGAGGAGLTAGNAALESGATDVIILEKMAFVGGATNNAGGIDAGMSKLQAELNMEGDSVELIKSDILRSGFGHNEALVDIMAENQGATLDWLKESENVPFNNRYSGDFPEHTVQRFFVCDGGMANCMTILAQNFEDKGGKIYLNTRATELIVEDGKVVGVKAVDDKDNTYIIKADATVIATGGYGSNDEMISEKKSDLSYAVFYGAHSSMGDGHKLGQSVNAKMTLMGYAKLYPNGIAQPGTNDGKATPMPTLNTVNQTGSIFVNKEGNRFVNETLAFADIKNATCEQPDEIMYLVMDEAGYKMWSEQVQGNSSAAGRIDAETMENYFQSEDTWPTFTRGTVEEAAKLAGIDAEALAKTIADWNATVSAGEDKEFGRKALTAFDTEGTVYIVEQRLRFATTLGGFDITANFEAQTEDGAVIDGLYAIGECVGGPNGSEAIPGSMACWALTSGRMLGLQLGAELSK